MRPSKGTGWLNVVSVPLLGLICAALPAHASQTGSGPKPAATVDFSGVKMFLELTARLEQEQEPTAEEWDRMFSTPGYAALTKSEFRRDFFVERFRLAFMPSRKADLDAQMKKDTGFWAQFLPHYLRAKQMRKDIERRVAEMSTVEFRDEAIKRASRFLPASAAGGTPAVAFVVFAPDSRGYDPVVIDILYMNDREEFLDTVAHEFHHWYRNRLAADLTRDQGILWVIQQVQLEGIADLINVPGWINRPVEALRPADKAYLDWYRRSGEVIQNMDRLFAQMQDNPAARRELGADLQKAVPRSGHPTGYFMAQTIVETLGREAVVATVSNPFAFFRVYNDAAKKKGSATPVFSEKAMNLLRSLERRYQGAT
jgi:hypothetical protein